MEIENGLLSKRKEYNKLLCNLSGLMQLMMQRKKCAETDTIHISRSPNGTNTYK